jgi:hypothetical protein
MAESGRAGPRAPSASTTCERHNRARARGLRRGPGGAGATAEGARVFAAHAALSARPKAPVGVADAVKLRARNLIRTIVGSVRRGPKTMYPLGVQASGRTSSCTQWITDERGARAQAVAP